MNIQEKQFIMAKSVLTYGAPNRSTMLMSAVDYVNKQMPDDGTQKKADKIIKIYRNLLKSLSMKKLKKIMNVRRINIQDKSDIINILLRRDRKTIETVLAIDIEKKKKK